MKQEMEYGFRERKSQLIIDKVLKFFEELGVVNIQSSVEDDGVHFFIALPREHVETRKKQAASLNGVLDPTQFDRDVLIPFKKRFVAECGEYLECKFLSKRIDSAVKEFVVSDKKF